jgi:uncharacterized membrane protein YgcG
MKRLVVTAGVVFAVLVTPGAAHAQTSTPPCEATVVDTTGKVADIAKVEDAAAQLRSAGAYVRVRVESNVGSDAEARIREMQANCPDWMSGGLRRPDLIAVVVLVDTRQTGIYYGSQYASSLDGSWKDIQASSMNPRFKEGLFDVGVADGLDAIRAAVTGTATPTSPPYSYPSYSSPSSASDTGTGIAGVVVLVALGIGFIVLLNVIAAKRSDSSGSYGSGWSGSGTKRRATGWFGGASSSNSSNSSWSSSSSSDSGWSSSSSSSSDSGSSSSDGGGGSSSW